MENQDVEKLLQWAYREELPKRPEPPITRQWERIKLFGDLGGMTVDETHEEPGFMGGSPHPDAIALDAAVGEIGGAFGEVAVDWQRNRAALMGAQLCLSPEADPLPASFDVRSLIIIHAKMGKRPDWSPDPMTPGRVVGSNGKPVVYGRDETGAIVAGRDKSRHYLPEAHCRLLWDPSPASVAFDRAQYSVWHAGLVELAEGFRSQRFAPLSRFAVNGPTTAAKPWLTGETASGRVLPNLLAPALPAARRRVRSASRV